MLTRLQKGNYIYGRLSRPTSNRFEHVLSAVLGGECLTYSSGLAAIHAYLVQIRPKKVAIGGGYHGTHDVLELQEKLTGCKKVRLENVDELGEGDVIHLETPVNPSGEARNIAAFAEVARSKGCYLVVDSTFGPPALQDPFQWGADIVVHSGTKFIGGHSDMMCGILAVSPQRQDLYNGLFADGRVLGSIPGGFEAWLGLRSMRTLDIRTRQQSKTCGQLVASLSTMLGGSTRNVVQDTLADLKHASLQSEDMEWLQRQMPCGFGSVFMVVTKTEDIARRLPSKLRIFQHATSLGGVESLIEWRKMTDNMAEGNVLRLSIGIEPLEDLQKDLLNGLQALVDEGTCM